MLQIETQGSLPDFNLDLQHLEPQNQFLLLQNKMNGQPSVKYLNL